MVLRMCRFHEAHKSGEILTLFRRLTLPIASSLYEEYEEEETGRPAVRYEGAR